MSTPHDPARRRQAYQSSHAQHGASPKSLQWKDYRAAAQRFVQLTTDLDIAGRLVLDAGCGMGDLLPYLYAKITRFDYCGIDITPEFIDIAQQRYQGHDFMVGDPFNQPMERTFDIVVSSGVMNANEDDWLPRRKAMISRLFDLANETAAFNMAGWPYQQEAHGKVAYADIETIINYCYTLSPKLIVRNHYHPRDFTITLFK